MGWIELITASRGVSQRTIGTFGVSSIKYSISLPKFFMNKPFRVEVNGNVVRYRLDPKSSRKISGISVGTQKNVRASLQNEEQCVYYVDEDAMYISPYSLGREYLEKFLRKEGII